MGGPPIGMGGPPMGGPGQSPDGQTQPKNTVQRVRPKDVWEALRKSLGSESDGQKKED